MGKAVEFTCWGKGAPPGCQEHEARTRITVQRLPARYITEVGSTEEPITVGQGFDLCDNCLAFLQVQDGGLVLVYDQPEVRQVAKVASG